MPPCTWIAEPAHSVKVSAAWAFTSGAAIASSSGSAALIAANITATRVASISIIISAQACLTA